MGRRLLYYGAAAAAAAAALADAYDVQPAPSEGGVSDAVILIDDQAPDAGQDGVRLIGLAKTGTSGPWPDAWYAVLPADAPAAMLARTVANAFADLDATAETARLERDLSELNAVGIRLSSEQDPRVLFETILS